ncbi:MAG: hypothetical protein H7Z37_15720 [Pyrinomonadaceae bacterium]|nr:hypothetical protein [Pyrinomonadaceae bacterium]
MKKFAFLRSVVTALMIFSLLTSPIFAAANLPVADKKGEKNFKVGLQHEIAERWDKAAEEFALAIAANPGNTEFRLHYQRSLFNASQMMMQRGRALSEQKDYVGAYNAFRMAYGYDPVNELAKSEMSRMLRLQQSAVEANDPNQPPSSPTSQPPAVKLVPTSYRTTVDNVQPQINTVPQLEQLRDLKYNEVDLKTIIGDLASGLDLNVLFEPDTFRTPKKVTIKLSNVTAAQALDYIFLQEKLFFQKVGDRTIMVANTNQRQNFQQLVLRTFYLANAKPAEVRTVISQAIPPQPGRAPTIVIPDDSTNSLTVRDTSENIKLIGNLIKSLDKDRAEVVMDVNIYEVTKSDLLNLGLQVGDGASVNLGGSTGGLIGIGENGRNLGSTVTGGVRSTINQAIGTAFLVPPVRLNAFQSKGSARIIASTQIHAFNGEDSEATIGSRVPVRSAQLLGFGNPGTGGGTGTGGVGGGIGNGFGNAAEVFNYEQVGLKLKFKPTIFPNQDVQVQMTIESKDIGEATTVSSNPTFTERTIKGTARIQNNRTLLLASVAQNNQRDSRSGIPILGLIPVLGRLFTSPQKDNRQVDIVIAVTPRVLRAPSILPEDEMPRETGSLAAPTNSSLAQMIENDSRDEQLAAARRLGSTTRVQLPDMPPIDAPGYVSSTQTTAAKTNAQTTNTPSQNVLNNVAPTFVPQPIDVKATTQSPVLTATTQSLQPVQTTQTTQPNPQNAPSNQVVVPQTFAPTTIPPNVQTDNAAPQNEQPNNQTSQVVDNTGTNVVKKIKRRPTTDVAAQNVSQNDAQIPATNVSDAPVFSNVADANGAIVSRTKSFSTPVLPKENMNGFSATMPEIVMKGNENNAAASAELKVTTLGKMRKGEKKIIPVQIKALSPFRLAVLSMGFDSNQLAVRQVFYGDIFGTDMAKTPTAPSVNSNGMLVMSLLAASGNLPTGSGVLTYIEVEALQDTSTEMRFDANSVNVVGVSGENFNLRFK